MSIVPFDDPKRYERVEDDYEEVGDDEEVVDEDEVVVQGKEYERVEDEVVEEKPEPKPLTREEAFLNAVARYRFLERLAEKVRNDIKFYREVLKEEGIKYSPEKLRRKIKSLKRELDRLRAEMRELALTALEKCPRREKRGACNKCPHSDICLRALNYLERRKQKKIRGWFRR